MFNKIKNFIINNRSDIRFLFACIIVTIFFSIVISVKYIPSPSMENTLMTGDIVITYKLNKNYERGDIIVFKEEHKMLCKRIIALPGETIDIIDDKVYIDGEILDEPYLREIMVNDDSYHYVVPDDSYFVMGDNRNNSHDSRKFENTFIPKENIKGKVKYIIFPFKHIKRLD